MVMYCSVVFSAVMVWQSAARFGYGAVKSSRGAAKYRDALSSKGAV